VSVKKLKSELLVVVRDLKRLCQKIDKITKRVEKIEKPQKTKTVALREVPGCVFRRIRTLIPRIFGHPFQSISDTYSKAKRTPPDRSEATLENL